MALRIARCPLGPPWLVLRLPVCLAFDVHILILIFPTCDILRGLLGEEHLQKIMTCLPSCSLVKVFCCSPSTDGEPEVGGRDSLFGARQPALRCGALRKKYSRGPGLKSGSQGEFRTVRLTCAAAVYFPGKVTVPPTVTCIGVCESEALLWARRQKMSKAGVETPASSWCFLPSGAQPAPGTKPGGSFGRSRGSVCRFRAHRALELAAIFLSFYPLLIHQYLWGVCTAGGPRAALRPLCGAGRQPASRAVARVR